MKQWKLLSVMLLTGVALILMTSMVAAAPAAANGVQFDRMNDDPIMTSTLPMTQPVAAAIAAYFNLSYTEVISLHEAGYGYGVIARVYLTALRSNGVLTPTQLFDLFQAGMGWGQIMKQYGIHPGGNGLGSIMRQHGAPAPVVSQPAIQPPVSQAPSKSGNSGSTNCPGNSCNAPGRNKGPKK